MLGSVLQLEEVEEKELKRLYFHMGPVAEAQEYVRLIYEGSLRECGTAEARFNKLLSTISYGPSVGAGSSPTSFCTLCSYMLFISNLGYPRYIYN